MTKSPNEMLDFLVHIGVMVSPAKPSEASPDAPGHVQQLRGRSLKHLRE